MVLGLAIPGGRTGVSTKTVLKGSGKGERQGGKELEREREGEGQRGRSRGQGVKGANA